MIKINANNENLENELLLIYKLFYGKEVLEIDDVVNLNIENYDNKYLIKLSLNEKKYTKTLLIDDLSETNKIIKKEVKVLLYKILSKKTKKKIPYGSLTGIRPTKLFYELLEKNNYNFDIVRNIFLSEYQVSEAKTNLLERIVKNQNIDRNNRKIDLYINIPFCTSKCYYCSFISKPLSACKQYVEPYIEKLKIDIKNALEIIKSNNLILENIYMGGGTPTALSANQLEAIIRILPKTFKEFTVECGRPDTITDDKLNVLNKYGVTRISVNPQTFNNRTLKEIGRNHNTQQTISAYENARKYPFIINMDLIAGLGNERYKDFKHTLQKTLSLKPDNVTVHTLCLKRASNLNLEGGETSNEKDVEKMVNYSIKKIIQNGYEPYYLYKQKNALANLENIGYFKDGKICYFNVNSMEETRSIIACGANAISKKLFLDQNRIERCAFVKEAKEYIERHNEMLANRENLFNS